eukprot:TRINITY_DN9450_c0_g2_i3.p4 TRINITY_DN9450_c0_g2~~TRINITY_DN9450_c0_g2_i3.p4  ORF type:complete len:144 (-),score=4.68 TRINITY_DN9450_c0_g2_i3:755-1147(-)
MIITFRLVHNKSTSKLAVFPQSYNLIILPTIPQLTQKNATNSVAYTGLAQKAQNTHASKTKILFCTSSEKIKHHQLNINKIITLKPQNFIRSIPEYLNNKMTAIQPPTIQSTSKNSFYLRMIFVSHSGHC